METKIGDLFCKNQDHGVRTEYWIFEGANEPGCFYALVSIFQNGKRLMGGKIIKVNEFELAKMERSGYQAVNRSCRAVG